MEDVKNFRFLPYLATFKEDPKIICTVDLPASCFLSSSMSAFSNSVRSIKLWRQMIEKCQVSVITVLSSNANLLSDLWSQRVK